jgi:hypothetical protein
MRSVCLHLIWLCLYYVDVTCKDICVAYQRHSLTTLLVTVNDLAKSWSLIIWLYAHLILYKVIARHSVYETCIVSLCQLLLWHCTCIVKLLIWKLRVMDILCILLCTVNEIIKFGVCSILWLNILILPNVIVAAHVLIEWSLLRHDDTLLLVHIDSTDHAASSWLNDNTSLRFLCFQGLIYLQILSQINDLMMMKLGVICNGWVMTWYLVGVH